jgi:hypothetical protein
MTNKVLADSMKAHDSEMARLNFKMNFPLTVTEQSTAGISAAPHAGACHAYSQTPPRLKTELSDGESCDYGSYYVHSKFGHVSRIDDRDEAHGWSALI